MRNQPVNENRPPLPHSRIELAPARGSTSASRSSPSGTRVVQNRRRTNSTPSRTPYSRTTNGTAASSIASGNAIAATRSGVGSASAGTVVATSSDTPGNSRPTANEMPLRKPLQGAAGWNGVMAG